MKCRLCPNQARTGHQLCRPCRRRALGLLNETQWIPADSWTSRHQTKGNGGFAPPGNGKVTEVVRTI